MIRITTDNAIDAGLKRQRLALASQYANAVETLLPEPCTHRDRPSCPVCAVRRTIYAAARAVRETGGQQQRRDGRDG
jgi:hypothetical protein